MNYVYHQDILNNIETYDLNFSVIALNPILIISFTRIDVSFVQINKTDFEIDLLSIHCTPVPAIMARPFNTFNNINIFITNL